MIAWCHDVYDTLSHSFCSPKYNKQSSQLILILLWNICIYHVCMYCSNLIISSQYSLWFQTFLIHANLFSVFQDSIYAVGGNDGISSLDKCEKYDPLLNKWSFIAPMNRHRAGAGVAELDGYLYVVGKELWVISDRWWLWIAL